LQHIWICFFNCRHKIQTARENEALSVFIYEEDEKRCSLQCREHSSQFLAGAPLGIPQKYTVESIVAIGYPAEDKKPYNENELPFEKIHFNRY
jgi:hypothetical protein